MVQLPDQCKNCMHDVHGARAGSISTAPLNKPGTSTNTHDTSKEVAFGWSDLRDVLVQWLPKGSVQLGKRFTMLLQHDDHVVVRFTDGTRVEARAVVGADGCFSQVRQHTLGDGPPEAAVGQPVMHTLHS